MRILRWAILLLAFAPLAYYLLASFCTWEYFRKQRGRRPADPAFLPPISILKPVRGVDEEAYENFASFCRLDYPVYEVVFAVRDADDPVIPVVRKLQEDLPGCDIRLLVGVPALGLNRKVNNLCRLSQEAKYELLVVCDSDLRVEPDYLRQVAWPFADPSVGAVTTFFRGIAGSNLGAKLSGLVLATETMPNALVARRMEGCVQFAFGWTMATWKTDLAAIGGFEAMVNHHSDDFELGNRIAASGKRVELLPYPIWMVFPAESLRAYLRHELRWAIGLRNVRPAGYLGLFLTFGLVWVVLAALVSGSATIATAYMAAYLAARLGQVWLAGVWGMGDLVTRNNLWLVPLRDLLNVAVWTAGLFSDTVSWRGLRFRVKERLLAPVNDEQRVSSGG